MLFLNCIPPCLPPNLPVIVSEIASALAEMNASENVSVFSEENAPSSWVSAHVVVNAHKVTAHEGARAGTVVHWEVIVRVEVNACGVEACVHAVVSALGSGTVP